MYRPLYLIDNIQDWYSIECHGSPLSKKINELVQWCRININKEWTLSTKNNKTQFLFIDNQDAFIFTITHDITE